MGTIKDIFKKLKVYKSLKLSCKVNGSIIVYGRHIIVCVCVCVCVIVTFALATD